MGSAVLLPMVSTDGMCSCADAAVLLAPAEGRTTPSAPTRSDDACAGRVGVIGVALVVVLGGGSLDDVGGSLERGELGAASGDLDAELLKSGS